MTYADSPSDYLDRAKMHDQLAASTNDMAARQMHQAMAAEFRRRAQQAGSEAIMSRPTEGPILEIIATAA